MFQLENGNFMGEVNQGLAELENKINVSALPDTLEDAIAFPEAAKAELDKKHGKVTSGLNAKEDNLNPKPASGPSLDTRTDYKDSPTNFQMDLYQDWDDPEEDEFDDLAQVNTLDSLIKNIEVGKLG